MHEDFYKMISPERLKRAAEEAGIGGDFPVDLKEILRLFPKKKTCRVLEIGCGTGRLGSHFIAQCDYVGIDRHEVYLDYFKDKLQELGISFLPEQLQNISFFGYEGRNFDVILFPWSVIGDFSEENQTKALAKSKKMLNEGGIVILDNPAKGEIYNTAPGYNPAMFYFDDWKDEFVKLGFSGAKQVLYMTTTGRKREISILYS